MTELLSIAKKLEKINRKCYVVGSFCVHKILEKEFDGDIDLTTDATSDEIRHVLKVVGEIGQKYGTLIISE
jgi:tRNA nucleotidyltransferase/poly(A) polymerase